MPFNQKPQKFNAKINPVTIGSGDKTVTIGGRISWQATASYQGDRQTCIKHIRTATTPSTCIAGGRAAEEKSRNDRTETVDKEVIKSPEFDADSAYQYIQVQADLSLIHISRSCGMITTDSWTR